MKMKLYYAVTMTIMAFIVITSFTNNSSVNNEEIPYPEGYRTWTHIKTGLVGPQNPNFQLNGGFHHIYANSIAMQGYTSGYFANGSVLVFDVLAPKEQNGNTQEGSRKHLSVMVKDSLKYASTGGWGYEDFSGDSHTQRTLTTEAKIQCFNCHAREDDNVFSEFRK